MSPPSNKSPYRLAVEGPDDKWTCIHLLQRHGFDWEDSTKIRPYVHPAGGITQLLDKAFLSTALKNHERLGLVLDSDFPPPDRWHQLRGVLTGLGIILPDTPVPEGVVVGGREK